MKINKCKFTSMEISNTNDEDANIHLLPSAGSDSIESMDTNESFNNPEVTLGSDSERSNESTTEDNTIEPFPSVNLQDQIILPTCSKNAMSFLEKIKDLKQEQVGNPLKRKLVAHECSNNVIPDFEAPKYGTKVDSKIVRKAGAYTLGPMIGSSPVKSIMQCLAKKDGTDKYYTIKILTLKDAIECETQDDRQGKMLLHSEYSLLSLLQNQEGVVHHHGFFKVFKVLTLVKF